MIELPCLLLRRLLLKLIGVHILLLEKTRQRLDSIRGLNIFSYLINEKIVDGDVIGIAIILDHAG